MDPAAGRGAVKLQDQEIHAWCSMGRSYWEAGYLPWVGSSSGAAQAHSIVLQQSRMGFAVTRGMMQ